MQGCKMFKLKKAVTWSLIFVMMITLFPANGMVQGQEIPADSIYTKEVTSGGAITIGNLNTAYSVTGSEEPQPGGSNIWRVTGSLGNYDNWDTNNNITVMKHLVGEYYTLSLEMEGSPVPYEFKFTKNGGWDGAIGDSGGDGNFIMTISQKTKVTFYLNDEMGAAVDKVRISFLGQDGSTIYDPSANDKIPSQYIPSLSKEKWPRLVGDIQPAISGQEEGAWNTEQAQQMFIDYYFDNTVYKLQRTVPKGSYECKVLFGATWDNNESYGGANGNLVAHIVDDSADVTFSINYGDKNNLVLSHDYKGNNTIYDGAIDTKALEFDSRSITYKKPFGAVKQGQEDVTFRLGAKAKDAQYVKLELIDNNGISRAYNMSVATVVNGKDYWEVIVPKTEFKEIGIWGYKFIIIDGLAKAEYGDDGASGGTGAVSEEGQTPYNLSVYAADYKTPDWMKDAVVYQIFPDRFFDGDTTNNQAKTLDGVRGDQVQLFDGDKWSVIPENPRQSEEANKPYYPDATTDGVWSNEFYGGDIAGIEGKLMYLKNLGVTAIYLNPVSWAASNHKYDATDYKHLDPMFGQPVYNKTGDPASGLNYEATKIASDKVYQKFADSCAKLNIHLISDGVFNHVGDDSIYFDRYEKYPEIGAYEFWNRVWKEVETRSVSKEEGIKTVKSYYKSQVNPNTGKSYTDPDFNFTEWFDVGPDKVYDEKTGKFVRYSYEGWWGYDSLPVIKTIEAANTNLSNDSNATIAGAHEYNNVDFRENVIGYNIKGLSEGEASAAMEKANAQRWLWMGSSGWRLDVAPDVSDATWQEFRKSVKSAEGYKDVNGNTIADPIILGEEWNVATHYLLGDMFDSVMNYQFRAAVQNFIVNGKDAKELNNALETIRENYPKEAWEAMLNLVDSHDTVRNITKIDNPSWEEENTKIAPEASEKAIKLQALTSIFQMSYPGAPTIYYGDEVGVVGTKDPDSRRSFPWERVSGTNISSTYREKYGDLYNTYVNAAKVRNDYKDIFATGELKTAYAQGTVIAYARKSDKKGGLSLINRGEQEVTITGDVTDFLPDGIILTDKLGSGTSASIDDGKMTITVPGYTGMMMVSDTEFSALPAAPANLRAEAVEGSVGKVGLTWDGVSGATGYKVYRTLLEGMGVTEIGTVTGTNYIDLTVDNGTRYYYYVKSFTDSAESIYSQAATALPSYKITSVTQPTEVAEIEIGVGKKTEESNTTITIPGLTDQTEYIGKDVKSLIFTLAYYTGHDPNTAKETKLTYLKDEGDGKVYAASFEPTEAGVYQYFAKATVNNGATYVTSPTAQVEVKLKTGVQPPLAPVLTQPESESNRVTLGWSGGGGDIAGYDIYRTEGKAGIKLKIDTVDQDALSYIDYAVNNDTEYKYIVEAFTADYSRAASNEISVMPKLVMVDVTFRLNIPTKVYTSTTDNIYIASDQNGWNASGWMLKKPSGATDTNVVEYSFKMMAGKKIQYKYTRGNWDSEALTGKRENDIDNPGNYGYSSIDTNISLVIKNEGGNKMFIEDTVLRWVDMPMMVTIPRISYGKEDITFTTSDTSFNLKASVPYGGTFTINNKNINEMQPGELDKFGNVKLDNIPLKTGANTFILHIEPTQETRNKPWLVDTARIETQMTATKNVTITRTGGTGNDSGSNGNSGSSSGPGGSNIPEETEAIIIGNKDVMGWEAIRDDIKEKVGGMKDKDKTLKINIDMNINTVLPSFVLEEIRGKNAVLILKLPDCIWTIDGKSIKKKVKKDVDLAVHDITSAAKITVVKYLEVKQGGTLPFSAKLTINIGKKQAGKTFYISSYDGKSKKLKTYVYVKADKDGSLTFTVSKGGRYSITAKNLTPPAVTAKVAVAKGKTYRLKLKNLLGGEKITYKTNGKSIATVSKAGKITGKKPGKTTITTTITQGTKVYKVKTLVTIKQK